MIKNRCKQLYIQFYLLIFFYTRPVILPIQHALINIISNEKKINHYYKFLILIQSFL